MGRRQFGNVEKLPSGRWRARYNVDGRWFSAGRTFETKGEAGRFLDRIRTELDRGEWRDPRLGKTLLQDRAETFMSSKADLAPRTASGYYSLLRSRILPALGAMQLVKIRPSDVRRWLADMAKDGLSASRRRQALGLLSQIMDAAVADGIITTSPCASVPAPALPLPEPDYLTPDEVERLVAATPRPWDLLVLIMIYGGLRWGEAAALRRSSCNLLRSRLLITESLAEVNGKLHFGPTKTHQRRTVSLPTFVRDRLAEHLESEVDAADDALVFTSRRGTAVRYSHFFPRIWKPATRAAGVEGVGTHIATPPQRSSSPPAPT